MSGVLRVVVTSSSGQGTAAQISPGGRLVIGRAPEVELYLHDPRVARRHVVIEFGLGGAKLCDLGSRNGCRVDGVRVDGEVRLRGGETLEIGQTRLLVTLPTRAQTPQIPGVQLLARLGSGAAGTVYEGLRGGQRVAVKVLAAAADDTEARRLVREAELSSRLSHCALPRVHDLCSTVDGALVLIRELIPGDSLAQRVTRLGALDWPEACGLGAALAGALAHAHERGVVHRDVKPQNVILSPTGPKLIDLGLGRATSASELTRLTASGEGLGTLLYLAPEQLTDAHRVDGKADVCGLGLTLYYALVGEPPFMDVEPEDFLTALRERGPSPLPDHLPQVVRSVLASAYARSASDRPTAAELRRALRQLEALGADRK